MLAIVALYGLSNHLISSEEFNTDRVSDVEPVHPDDFNFSTGSRLPAFAFSYGGHGGDRDDEQEERTKNELLERSIQEKEVSHENEPDKLVISNLTPENIKNLDEDINQWTPQQLQQLSAAQTEAIQAVPLISLNREQFLALPAAHLDPTALSQVFKYPSHIGHLPDSFVSELTPDQATAILDNQTNFLDSYLTHDQIKQLKTIRTDQTATAPTFQAPVHELAHEDRNHTAQAEASGFINVEHSDAQPAPMTTNKPSWWRKKFPTLSTIVDGLVKQFSRTSNISIASNAMRNMAQGTYDPNNDQSVDNAFRKITTKQKDSVMNDWLVQTKAIFAEKNRILQHEIDQQALMQSLPPAIREKQEEYIALMRAQIKANNEDLEKEIKQFTQKMSRYLSPDEQLIMLKNQQGMIRLEVVDMSEINPTKSIADQQQQLKNDGIINSYDTNWWNNTTASISAEALEQHYADWISNDIVQNFEPQKSITDQIELSALKLSKHEWRDFDLSLQQMVLDRVHKNLEAQLNHDASADTSAQTQPFIEDDIDSLMQQIALLDQQEAKNTPSVPEPAVDSAIDMELNHVVKKYGLLKISASLIPHVEIAVLASLTPHDFMELTDEQIHALTRNQIDSLGKPVLDAIMPRLTSTQLTYVKK